jgi:phosphoribosylanthranilate isomerase
MHGSPVYRTRVKICGITRPEDGVGAAQAGADAIGLVFYDRSPRAVDAARARAIVAALPPFVTTVGLFVDAAPAAVEAVLKAVPLDLLQFHGQEPGRDCERYGRPWVKAVQVRPGVDLQAMAEEYAGAQALLLDAYHPEVPGGTGNRFDWGLIPARLNKPIVLAGGLDAENVESAIRAVDPWGVDVSSGVEAGKGIKDMEKIAAFMRGVERANAR